MLFKEIPGNLKIKQQLTDGVKAKRVGQGYLFFGKSGSAKLSLAIAYSQFLNCEDKNKNDSCGFCASCLKYNKLSHPDLHISMPVLKINNLKNPISDDFILSWRDFIIDNYYSSLNDWFDFFRADNKTSKSGLIYKHEAENIRKKLALKNYESKYRIVLIWMPERMNLEASNKLLKLIEEPPKGTIFILVSENKNQLLPTVVSRLQAVKIPEFNSEDIVSYFGKKRVSFENAKILINTTGGDFGKIQKILNKDEDDFCRLNDFSNWMRLSYKVDIKGLSGWVDQIAKKGKKEQELFLSYAIKIVRESLVYNFGTKNLLKADKKELLFLAKFSPFIHEENSVFIAEKLEESIKGIIRNANAKILFFELSLQMVKLLKLKRKLAV